MKARDFIKSRLSGFLEYLRAIGINPNNINTDALYQLALLEEYIRYQRMMQAWQKAQQKMKEKDAGKWEDATFVSVWGDERRELRSDARVDIETGEVEILKAAETPEDLETLVDEYLIFRDKRWELLKDENGNYRIELPETEGEKTSDLEAEESVAVES